MMEFALDETTCSNDLKPSAGFLVGEEEVFVVVLMDFLELTRDCGFLAYDDVVEVKVL